MSEHVWFFNAHPDDLNASLGLALVLSKLPGYQIHVADFNRGERGLEEQGVSMAECGAIRTAEEEAVCAGLGVKPLFLPEIDGESFASRESCMLIESMLRETEPAAVITHWPVDIHSDHVMCGAAVIRAVRKSRLPIELYFYRQNKQCRNFPQDIYFPFDSDIMDSKCELLKLYACQNGAEIADRERCEDRYNGYRCGAPFAEVYASFQKPLPAAENFFTKLEKVRALF